MSVRLGILPGARIGAAGVASARVAGALDGGAVGAVGVCGFDDDELDADADDSVTCDCTG